MDSEIAKRWFVGVDVGTGSARAGLFSTTGKLLNLSKKDIRNDQSPEGYYEQSTTDIWSSVCAAVKDVCRDVDLRCVHGIGFTATCSLAVVDENGSPVTISPTLDPYWNVISWRDHRAVKETDEINSKLNPVLEFVGGKISVEMQPPKLMWLKKNLKEHCWDKARHFFDLADYLVYRSTGHDVRSLCCLVCKWTYVGHQPTKESGLTEGWNSSFWHECGLGDLADGDYNKIGSRVYSPGDPVGEGLSLQAAEELGLIKGTPVAASLIDAHAGGVGMVGADLSLLPSYSTSPISSRLALIAGTSSCLMATADRPILVPGVWGPYFSAMVTDKYLNEGGQSAAGALLDRVLQYYSDVLKEVRTQSGTTDYHQLNHILNTMASSQQLSHTAMLTRHHHIVPDFHGNRSPLADPLMRGMISGLSLSHTVEDMCLMYLATIQALAYSTRHIMESMQDAGHNFSLILLCGGLRSNQLYLQTHADVTGLPVLLTEESEAVLLGAAILAAKSSEPDISLTDVMKQMSRVQPSSAVQPSSDPELKKYHELKYQVYRTMVSDQIKYREMM